MQHPDTGSQFPNETPAFWIAADGRIVDANAAAARLLGQHREALPGMDAVQAGVLADRQGLDRLWEELRDQGAAVVQTQAIGPGGCRLDGAVYAPPGHEVAVILLSLDPADRGVLAALAETERNLRAVLDATADTVALIDTRGVLLDINETGANRFGLPREELAGWDIFERFPAPLAASRRRRLQEVLQTRRAVRFLDSRDGSIFENHLYPVLDQTGAVDRVAVYVRDITAKVEAEEAARAARSDTERFRRNLEAMFASIPLGLVLVDDSLQLLEANQPARSLCPALHPSPENEPFATDCDGACRTVLEQVLSRKEPVSEYRTRCDSGQGGPRTLSLNAAIAGEAGEPVQGAVLVIRDETRLADMERRLRQASGWRNMVGASDAMQRVYDLLDQLMETDAGVLIVGESGTGKELAAEALHYGGPRASGPLVKVNCSALSESLLESELFGHVRGAFTGASRDKVGRFQAAHGGAIFLDEIGDVSPLIQLKLLRFLESREFERVGESRTRTVDVRVLAATNADLPRKVADGSFRADLYYRLKVLEVRMPPLRERREDIPDLARRFLHQFSERYLKPLLALDDAALHALLNHDWPGNVRELKHCLEHAAIVCREETIQPGHLPLHATSQAMAPEPAAPKQRSRRSKLDRENVEQALRQAGGNKSEAARLLGVNRRTLYRRLEALGGVDGLP